MAHARLSPSQGVEDDTLAAACLPNEHHRVTHQQHLQQAGGALSHASGEIQQHFSTHIDVNVCLIRSIALSWAGNFGTFEDHLQPTQSACQGSAIMVGCHVQLSDT